MTPIFFKNFVRMSEENTSAQERNAVAQAVLDAQGVDGLVTLWACQDFYESSTPLNAPATPASQWWLASDNPYAKMVIGKLVELSERDGLALLSIATRPPRVSADTWVKRNMEPATSFCPNVRSDFSNATAAVVRQLAQVFFPQYPAFSDPQCNLYLSVAGYNHWDENIDTVGARHSETLQAFSDDAMAMQYLLRVHEDPDVSREYVTPEMEVLLSNTDAEWALFDSMGVGPEESYHIMKRKIPSDHALRLPNEFTI